MALTPVGIVFVVAAAAAAYFLAMERSVPLHPAVACLGYTPGVESAGCVSRGRRPRAGRGRESGRKETAPGMVRKRVQTILKSFAARPLCLFIECSYLECGGQDEKILGRLPPR